MHLHSLLYLVPAIGMIYFLIGDPGAGKSMYMVKLIVEDLVRGGVYVVTNEEINVATLRAYVMQRRLEEGMTEPWDMDDYFKLIPSEDVGEFWRHRSGDLVLESHPDRANADDDERGKRRRLSKQDSNEFMERQFARLEEKPEYQLPCHYYVAEAADYFDAQEWQTTGRAIKWYAQKHRHAHDNVWLNTQHIDFIELRLRNLAGETIQMVNHARRSRGLFRDKAVLRAHQYFKLPSPAKKPYRTDEMPIDVKGIGRCYRTTGALGVHTKPEAIRNAGRLPFWTLWVAGVALVAGLLFVFLGLPNLGSWYGRKMITKVAEGAKGVMPLPAASRSGAMSSHAPSEMQPPEARETPKEKVWVTGLVVSRNAVNVVLSDGRTLSEGDGILAAVSRNYVDLKDGTRIYRRFGSGSGSDPVSRAGRGVVFSDMAGRGATAGYDSGSGQPVQTQQLPAPSTAVGDWVLGADGQQHIRDVPHVVAH